MQYQDTVIAHLQGHLPSAEGDFSNVNLHQPLNNAGVPPLGCQVQAQAALPILSVYGICRAADDVTHDTVWGWKKEDSFNSCMYVY